MKDFNFKKGDIVYFYDNAIVKAIVDIASTKRIRVIGVNTNSSYTLSAGDCIVSKYKWIVKIHEILRILNM